MRASKSLLSATVALLSGCEVEPGQGEAFEAKFFDKWACAAKPVSEIASSLQTFADRQGATIGIEPIVVGGQGRVVELNLGELRSDGVQVHFIVFDGAAETLAHATKRLEPSDDDRRFAASALTAAELAECRSVAL